ncbi:MAG: glycosyl transferase family protein [Bacteroidetes bacterium]|jgi:glycosyltransferase involved in cell wall biosynthesis|nr:glycosyl transferase family protein [Bacteroidota bacterium]
MSVKVSVIIPCYNSAAYLTETLDSVMQQTFTDWECIIADNASTDTSKVICESYVEKDKRFRYLYLDKKGVSLARNTAIANSAGQYILPLDADDKIHPDYLARAVELLEKDKDLKLVYADAELFGAVNKKWTLPEYNYRDLLIENCVYCTALFRKVDFEKTKGYNENMVEGFEDWDFWIKFLDGQSKVHKIDAVLFYYRIRKESRNSSLDEELQRKLRKQIFENNKEVYNKYIDADFIFEFYRIRGRLHAIEKSTALKAGKLLVDPLIAFHKLIRKQ